MSSSVLHQSSFRAAVEARDDDAIAACLDDDVTLTSPVAFGQYQGKPITAAILRGVMRVFDGMTYVREIVSADGRDHALIFEARVGDRAINGCDFLHLNDEGLIDDLTVMVRPLSAAKALAQAMEAQFDQVQREATA